MGRAGVLELVRERLGDLVGREPSDIAEGERFADLGVDDLAMIELVESLEDELGERTVGFHVDDEDLEDLETVGDAVDYVVARLG
jgi:acyl carrier protein